MKRVEFTQLVEEPTHIEGQTIDLVFAYTSDDIQGTNIDVKLKSTYFTDHEIVYVHEANQLKVF